MDQSEWTEFGKNLSMHVNKFEDAGLTLGYHNHSYEFNPLPSGKLPIECMMEHNENLKFEIDLGWATAGGVDPLPWIEKYSNKLGVLEFTFIWNDYFWALVLTQGDTVKPITVGLDVLRGQWTTSWNLVSAGSVVAALPPVIMFFILQKQFIHGLTFGAVKG